MSAERNKDRRAEQRKLTRTRFMVRWQQVRPAGTALFAEICDTRETTQAFIVGWLWRGTKADGPVYVDRQQRDAAGKWQTLETEEVSRKT